MESIVVPFLGIAIIVSAIYFLASKRDTKGKIARIIIGTVCGAAATLLVLFLVLMIGLRTGLVGM